MEATKSVYLDVDKKDLEDVKGKCNELGYDVVMVTRASHAKSDKHLHIVLATKRNPIFDGREFCVFYYNNTTSGLCEGNYDLDFGSALEAMRNKVI